MFTYLFFVCNEKVIGMSSSGSVGGDTKEILANHYLTLVVGMMDRHSGSGES